MLYTEYGTLAVSAEGGGAIPIPDATVRIRGADEENRFTEYSLVTDRDGITERVSLPAPPRSLSLAPGAPEKPYASYDVEIIKEGFYTKRILGAAIFAGIDADIPVVMLPLGVGGGGGVITLTVTENERLE